MRLRHFGWVAVIAAFALSMGAPVSASAQPSPTGQPHQVTVPAKGPIPRPGSHSRPATGTESICNSYLAVQVSPFARFNLGGLPDPSTCGSMAGSYNLSYAWPNEPQTSYSTVRIDGNDYEYGTNGQLMTPPTNTSPTTNTSTWSEGPHIKTTQTLSMVTNPSTGHPDTALISYHLTNNDSAAHVVGMRVMIDTMLNSNDGAPFFVPGVGPVTTEMDFTGTTLPAFWQAFDSLTNTRYAAQGNLTGAHTTTPSRFVIAQWPRVVNSPYDYTVTPGLPVTSDSAVGIYWFPQAIPAGASITVSTTYGLTSSGGTPPPPPPKPRPIIFIPGITGSYLRNANQAETWPQAQKLGDCVFHFFGTASCDKDLLSNNALASDGSTIPGNPNMDVDAANGIQRSLDGSVGGAIDSMHVSEPFAGNKTTNIYDVTAQNFEQSGYTEVEPTDNGGLQRCAATLKCFIPVGVDWRKSAVFNAGRVLSVITNVLGQTGSDRVDIMAHSQGGLVVNALVHFPAAVGKIYRVVTDGTPWLGAPKLLGDLLFQKPCLVQLALGLCGIDPGVVQTLIANYPGAAELTPSHDYYAAAPYSPLLLVDNNGNPFSFTFNQALAIMAARLNGDPLHRDMSLINNAEAWHGASDVWAPLDPSLQLVRMVGYDATNPDTPCTSAPCGISGSGKYARGTGTITGFDVIFQNVYYGTGDGTVPLQSADVYNPDTGLDDRGGAHNLYYCGVSHQGLVQSTIVWDYALPFLEGSRNYTSDGVNLGCPDNTDGTLQGVSFGSGTTHGARAAHGVSVTQGALVSASGSGYADGTTVTLTIHSTPVVLGSTITDSHGGFSLAVGIPGTTSVGAHDLVVDGLDPQGNLREQSVPMTVTRPAPLFGTTSAISGMAADARTAVQISGLCVSAYPTNSSTTAGSAVTDLHGAYRISGLAPGTYHVLFAPCLGKTGYLPQWFGAPAGESVTAAKPVTLIRGGEQIDISANIGAAPTVLPITIPETGAGGAGFPPGLLAIVAGMIMLTAGMVEARRRR